MVDRAQVVGRVVKVPVPVTEYTRVRPGPGPDVGDVAMPRGHQHRGAVVHQAAGSVERHGGDVRGDQRDCLYRCGYRETVGHAPCDRYPSDAVQQTVLLCRPVAAGRCGAGPPTSVADVRFRLGAAIHFCQSKGGFRPIVVIPLLNCKSSRILRCLHMPRANCLGTLAPASHGKLSSRRSPCVA